MTKKKLTKKDGEALSLETVEAQIAALAEADEPEEFRVARRCVEIYNAEKGRKGEGAYFFCKQIDKVTTSGTDGFMTNPDDELFTFLFVRAVRDIGRDDGDYIALKELIAQVEAGASLEEKAA
jgi:hypothetical protein